MAGFSRGGAPSGAAGGDLAGSYPNPSVAAGAITNAKVAAGAAISGTKLASDLLSSQISDFSAAVLALLDQKQEVSYATAAALPSNLATTAQILTATANGALSVDGQAVVAGQRLLIKNEATQANNGIYVVTATGSAILPYVLTRAADYNQGSEMGPGDLVPVRAAANPGAVNDGTIWLSSATLPFVVGTTPITFASPPSSGGDANWTLVGSGGGPAFQNSWANATGTRPAEFRKLGSGLVVVVGLVTGGNNSVAFTLPVGYRPGNIRSFPAHVNLGAGDVAGPGTTVFTDGTVVVVANNSGGFGVNQYSYLDGVSFFAEG